MIPGRHNNSNSKDRMDMGYYDLLQVPSHASAKEIKKSVLPASQNASDKNPWQRRGCGAVSTLAPVYRIHRLTTREQPMTLGGEKAVDDDNASSV
jgi:hypothetical protein